MIHVYRYFTALTVLLVLCCTYALAVVPWLEPPPIVKAPTPPDSIPTPQISPAVQEEVARLFPPDAWQRKEPKVVETEQCTLLIQDYKRLPDGGLELKPCTLIFHSSAPPAQAGRAGKGRPIVLDAPLAELKFDRPLNLAKAEFGRVEKGTLSGEITIYSPPTTEGSRDELRVRTRAVWFDRQSIRTSNQVEFQYGDSTGRGRDLEMTLLHDPDGQTRAAKSKFKGLQTITLKHLDYLRIATAGQGLLGDATPAGGQATANQNATLEVTCRDEFAFDVPAQLARFVEHVEVRRLVPGAPPDQLRCDELLLAFSQRKTALSQSPAADDPLAGRLSRIVAMGRPAVLEAPSSGVHAEAAFMEYSLADRYITLKSDKQKKLPQVSLRQFEQHFIAPELHYQMADEGRLGRLHATGPGELRLLQRRGREQQIVTARWERELQIQPQGRNQVISLLDRASVTVDPLGRFDANELHLWVLEVPVETPDVESQSADQSQAAAKPKTTILPDRLLAVGNVRLVSPQLDADTSRLEAWFINLPAEPPRELPPAPPAGLIREPVQPAAFSREVQPQGTIRDAIRPPNMQKFHVAGGIIQMQLVVRERQFDLEDLTIGEHAQIDEIRTPLPGQEPICLRGDVLELRRGTQPEATLDIAGQPAEVAGRGTSIAGGKIEVRRGANEIQIKGPGEATMPAGGRSSASGRPDGTPNLGLDARTAPGPAGPAGPTKMHIVWQQGLLFDGLTAHFEGDVQIRTTTQTALAPVLEATLNRRIDFQAPSGQGEAELARVFLDGRTTGVYVESRGYDEFGEQVSREQLKARNLTIDRVAGTLHAAGPGWVSSVRRGSAGLPDAAAAARPATQPGAAEQNPQPLTSIHVAFEREIAGELASRWIEFRQRVRTTYSPASDFADLIVADPLGKLDERMMLMTSEKLRITEFVSPDKRSFEMRATEGTKVEGERIFVDAPIVGYASDKEVLTIEGDGRAKARIHAIQVVGQPPGWVEGERFRYNLRTGELQSDVVSHAHIPLPAGMKLPVPALPDPAKPTSKRSSRAAPP